jgi:hypothetical protein
MEHAHTIASSHDHILAAFLELGTLPDIAKRVNMSLAALANWASEHADLLANVHKLITTRCKLIAANLELAALTALAAVSSTSTTTDEPKLRERALERQRKAANAILRHRAWLERTLRVRGASGGPHAPPNSSNADSTSAHSQTATARPSPNAECRLANAASSQPKAPLSHRLAARRLESLAHTAKQKRAQGLALCPLEQRSDCRPQMPAQCQQLA